MKQETLHWLVNKVNGQLPMDRPLDGQIPMDRTLDVAQSSMTNLQRVTILINYKNIYCSMNKKIGETVKIEAMHSIM